MLPHPRPLGKEEKHLNIYQPLQIENATFSLNFNVSLVRIDFGDGAGPKYEPIPGFIKGADGEPGTTTGGGRGGRGWVWDVEFCKEYLRREGK